MWFKNIYIYKISEWNISDIKLEEALFSNQLETCSGSQVKTRGWLSPKGSGPYLYKQDNQLLICLGVDKKLLPVSVIRNEVKLRAYDIEQRQGFKPGRKQLKDLRESVTDELLPRAFTIQNKTFGWVDTVNKWLVVDAANLAKADEFIEMFIKATETVVIKMLRTNFAPSKAMKDWLLSNENPPEFTIDQDCELQGIGDQKTSIRFVRHSLETIEINKFIEAGMEVSKLGLTWNNKISFILLNNLQLKRIAPTDIAIYQNEFEEQDDIFDSDFALMVGEFKGLIKSLINVLGNELD